MRLRLSAMTGSARASATRRGSTTSICYSHPAAFVAAVGLLAGFASFVLWLEHTAGTAWSTQSTLGAVVMGLIASATVWLGLRQRDRLVFDADLSNVVVHKCSGPLSEATCIPRMRVQLTLQPIVLHGRWGPEWRGYSLVLCDRDEPVMVLSMRRTLEECRRDCALFPEAIMRTVTERKGTIRASRAI